MGTGKSIARALLGGLAGSAGFYGDMTKQHASSSDDLYNALARLQMAQTLEQSSPLYAQQLEEARLANEINRDKVAEIGFQKQQRRDLISQMRDAQAARETAAAQQAKRDKIIAIAKDLYTGNPDYNPALPFMPSTIPTTIPTSAGDPELARIENEFLDEQNFPPGSAGADWVVAMKEQQGSTRGPDVPMTWQKHITATPAPLSPTQQSLNTASDLYGGPSEAAARSVITSRESALKIQEAQDMAFAKVVGERTGKIATGADMEDFTTFVSKIPKSMAEDLDMEEAIDLWLETKGKIQARTLDPSQAAGSGYAGQPVIKLD